MLRPTRWRRRTPIIEAIHITPSNVDDIAEWCGARIEYRHGEPLLYLGHSVVPARIGDYAVRDEHADGWARCFPMKRAMFEAEYEPVCTCSTKT